jgi:hypothetical protein
VRYSPDSTRSPLAVGREVAYYPWNREEEEPGVVPAIRIREARRRIQDPGSSYEPMDAHSEFFYLGDSSLQCLKGSAKGKLPHMPVIEKSFSWVRIAFGEDI